MSVAAVVLVAGLAAKVALREAPHKAPAARHIVLAEETAVQPGPATR